MSAAQPTNTTQVSGHNCSTGCGCGNDIASLGIEVRTDLTSRLAYSPDASHYRFTPESVVIARNADDVAAVFRAARAHNKPVTFRAGGTSLAGQSAGDGLLVDTRKHFTDVEILDNGERVRVQPGVTIRKVNAYLSPYGRKLGPDPASEIACTIGGVVANNSSGMACGTEYNTYRTLDSMTFVLPSGTVINTADADADDRLRQLEPELYATLDQLKARVRGNNESVAKIERHFALKNTMGYGLNSFLDYDKPVEILEHLIIGSEGTLAFVAEAVFRTIPIQRLATTSVAVFTSLEGANQALPSLVESGAATLELMDSTSLRVGQALSASPASIKGFDVVDHSALLVEYHANSAEELAEKQQRGQALLDGFGLHRPAQFSTAQADRTAAWQFRKGLYASVAGARQSGTTALLEDIAVPYAKLTDTCVELKGFFDQYGYDNAVIFGHAKDGNIHFLLTDRFEGDAALERYNNFNESLVELVLGFGGNLKAEHGTGRAMAPYVQRQYGEELYDVMRQLKQACDPRGIMNPGVILDEDPYAHVRNIKLNPSVEKQIDNCVECGYCEPVCPSRNLTLTPRQRIVLRRARQRLLAEGDTEGAAQIAKDYGYKGISTCAVDSMCQTACPLGIDTGAFIKGLRSERVGTANALMWTQAAKHWGTVTNVAGHALTGVKYLPAELAIAASKAARLVVNKDVMPQYKRELPGGGSQRGQHTGTVGAAGGEVVGIYIPACVNAMFGPAGDGSGAFDAFVELLRASGQTLSIPAGVDTLCCGTPWSSKGMKQGYSIMQRKAVDILVDATDHGRLPIIVDASSCTEGFRKLLKEAGLTVQDAVSFTAETILPALNVPQKVPAVTVHPTCSSTRLGINDALVAVAGAAAETVHVPVNAGCCAYAGDRGMLRPELTASATQAEAAEVQKINAPYHVSCNRTCELGISAGTGKEYSHVLELLAQVVRGE